MAQVFLYPAPGESPLDEDGNPFPSTGLRVTMNPYYEGQCRQGLLVRQDPSAFSSVAQPAVYAPFSLGYVTTQLASIPGVRDGREVETVGRATAVDGGGMKFRFALGVSSGADDYIKINTTDGQWQALTPKEQGGFRPEWFGAKRDGVTDDTAAINLAVQAGSANTMRQLVLSAGDYGICGSSSSNGVLLNVSRFSVVGAGATATRLIILANSSDGGGDYDNGARPAIDVVGFEIYIRGLMIHVNSLQDPRVAPASATNCPNRRHGIVVTGYRCTLEDLEINGPSGTGVRSISSTFQSQMVHCNITGCGISAVDLDGDNTWKMDRCGVGCCGWGFPLIYDRGGQLAIDTLNSVIAPNYYPGLPNGGVNPDIEIIRHAGLLSTKNCNFEAFTKCAIFTEGTVAPKCEGNIYFPSYGGLRHTGGGTVVASAVRVWMGDNIQTPELFDAVNKIFSPGVGGYGVPSTGAVDGAFFQQVQGTMPFICTGADRGNVWVSSAGAMYPTVFQTYATAGLGVNGVKISKLVVDRIKYTEQTQTTGTHAAICGHNSGDTTSGDVEFTVPEALYGDGDKFAFFKTAAANNLIIHADSGIRFGAATVTEITMTGLYDACEIERVGSVYYLTWKNY